MSPAQDVVFKLAKVLGAERADALIHEMCAETGIASLESPNDRYRFAEALIAREGVYEAVGRAIRVAALLQGANATPSPSSWVALPMTQDADVG
jgi:hypothetical protein